MTETAEQFETIDVGISDRVARVNLNRPDRLNAINKQMLAELPKVFALLADNDEVSVTILSGAGRSFSAGFDVQRSNTATGSDYTAHSPLTERAELRGRMISLLSVWDHPKPVIASVRGHCLAAATLLAAFSDLTIVAENAIIGLPSLPLGGGFLSPAWVHLVGPKRAKQMSLLAGEQIDGTTAALWGWANYAVPADELDDHVTDVARRMSRTPSDVLVLKKAAVNRIIDATGVRALLLSGAETDALAHQSEGVRTIQARIKAEGLKQTVAGFAAGEFEL